MHSFRLCVLVLSFVLSSACTTITPAEEAPSEQPKLISSLPDKVDTFELQGYKLFDDGSGGFSVRYANSKKRRIADLYVYPVAEENSDLGHNQLVLGSTRATLEAIGEAVRQGYYANFSVLNAATHANGLRTTARVKATYLRQNLASYTLVYQTEYEGTLLKIRVSMPDNESNRQNDEWDQFASTLFEMVIADMDKADTNKKEPI